MHVETLLLALLAFALLSAYAAWTWSVLPPLPEERGPIPVLSVVEARQEGNAVTIWVYNGGEENVETSDIVVLGQDGRTVYPDVNWGCSVVEPGETCVGTFSSPEVLRRVTVLVGAWRWETDVVYTPPRLPNIIIDVIAPPTALAGEDFPVDVNTCNVGEADTGAFTDALYVNGSLSTTWTLSLAPGECNTVTIYSYAGTAGSTIEFNAVADVYNVVAETNEADNWDTARTYVQALPAPP